MVWHTTCSHVPEAEVANYDGVVGVWGARAAVGLFGIMGLVCCGQLLMVVGAMGSCVELPVFAVLIGKVLIRKSLRDHYPEFALRN